MPAGTGACASGCTGTCAGAGAGETGAAVAAPQGVRQSRTKAGNMERALRRKNGKKTEYMTTSVDSVQKTTFRFPHACLIVFFELSFIAGQAERCLSEKILLALSQNRVDSVAQRVWFCSGTGGNIHCRKGMYPRLARLRLRRPRLASTLFWNRAILFRRPCNRLCRSDPAGREACVPAARRRCVWYHNRR